MYGTRMHMDATSFIIYLLEVEGVYVVAEGPPLKVGSVAVVSKVASLCPKCRGCLKKILYDLECEG